MGADSKGKLRMGRRLEEIGAAHVKFQVDN